MDAMELQGIVHGELKNWFGGQVGRWKHLKTYRIVHALPETGPRGLGRAESICPVEVGIIRVRRSSGNTID